MSVLVSTRHTILCMCDWVQCVGFCWGLALVLGLMCRIWLGSSPHANLMHPESNDSKQGDEHCSYEVGSSVVGVSTAQAIIRTSHATYIYIPLQPCFCGNRWVLFSIY